MKLIVKCWGGGHKCFTDISFFLDYATEQQEMDDHSHRYEGQSAQRHDNHSSYLPLNNGNLGDYSCQQLDHLKENKGTHNEHADRSAKTGGNIVISKPAFVKEEITHDENADGTVYACEIIVGPPDAFVKQENAPIEHINENIFMCENIFGQSDVFVKKESEKNEHAAGLCTVSMCENIVGQPDAYIKKEITDNEQVTGPVSITQCGVGQLDVFVKQVNSDYEYTERTMNKDQDNARQQDEHANRELFICEDNIEHELVMMEATHYEHGDRTMNTCDKMLGHPELHKEKMHDTGIIFFERKLDNYSKEELTSFQIHNRKYAEEIQLEGQSVFDHFYARKTTQKGDHSYAQHQCVAGTMYTSQQHNINKVTKLNFTHSEHPYSKVFVCKDNVKKNTEAFMEQDQPHNEHITETVTTCENNKGHSEQQEGKNTGVIFFKWSDHRRQELISNLSYKRKLVGEEQYNGQQMVDPSYARQSSNGECGKGTVNMCQDRVGQNSNLEELDTCNTCSEHAKGEVFTCEDNIEWRTEAECVEQEKMHNKHATESVITCEKSEGHSEQHKGKNAEITVFKCNFCYFSTYWLNSRAKYKRKRTEEKQIEEQQHVDHFYARQKGNDGAELHREMHNNRHLGEFSCKQIPVDQLKEMNVGQVTVFMSENGELSFMRKETNYNEYTEGVAYASVMGVKQTDGPLSCYSCEFSTPCSTRLKMHMRIHAKKTHKCDLCSYSTRHASQLDTHKRKHTGLKPLKCNLCDFSTNWMGSLKLHKRIHSKEKPYKCNLCDYRTSHSGNLKLHKKNHEKIIDYKCDPCGFYTQNYSQMREHRAKHRGEKRFKCDYCDYRANYPADIRKHEVTHGRGKRYKCDLCAYRTIRSDMLKQHKMRHDPCAEKPHKCPLCDFSAIRPDSVRIHLLTHKEKTIKCDVCEYSARDTSELNRHMKKHKGDDFVCEMCGYKTWRSRDLKRHQKTHTDEKPFLCDLCGFRTRRYKSLIVHKWRHTGEKPLKCNFCDFYARNKSSIKHHKKTVHAEQNLHK